MPHQQIGLHGLRGLGLQKEPSSISPSHQRLRKAIQTWGAQGHAAVPEDLCESIEAARADGVLVHQEHAPAVGRFKGKSLLCWMLAKGVILRETPKDALALERWAQGVMALTRDISLSQVWAAQADWEAVLSVPLPRAQEWIEQAQQQPELWMDYSGKLPIHGMVELGTHHNRRAQERLALFDLLHEAHAPAYQSKAPNPFVRVFAAAMTPGGSLDKLAVQWLVAHHWLPTSPDATGESALQVAKGLWIGRYKSTDIQGHAVAQAQKAEELFMRIDRVCLEVSPWEDAASRAKALRRMGLVEPSRLASGAKDEEGKDEEGAQAQVRKSAGEGEEEKKQKSPRRL